MIVSMPGVATAYEIRAVLTDTANAGLAGFLSDLPFNGGAFAPANTATTDPMPTLQEWKAWSRANRDE